MKTSIIANQIMIGVCIGCMLPFMLIGFVATAIYAGLKAGYCAFNDWLENW